MPLTSAFRRQRDLWEFKASLGSSHTASTLRKRNPVLKTKTRTNLTTTKPSPRLRVRT